MIRAFGVIVLCNVIAGGVIYGLGKAWLAVDATAVNQWFPGFVIGIASVAAAVGFAWLVFRRR